MKRFSIFKFTLVMLLVILSGCGNGGGVDTSIDAATLISQFQFAAQRTKLPNYPEIPDHMSRHRAEATSSNPLVALMQQTGNATPAPLDPFVEQPVAPVASPAKKRVLYVYGAKKRCPPCRVQEQYIQQLRQLLNVQLAEFGTPAAATAQIIMVDVDVNKPERDLGDIPHCIMTEDGKNVGETEGLADLPSLVALWESTRSNYNVFGAPAKTKRRHVMMPDGVDTTIDTHKEIDNIFEILGQQITVSRTMGTSPKIYPVNPNYSIVVPPTLAWTSSSTGTTATMKSTGDHAILRLQFMGFTYDSALKGIVLTREKITFNLAWLPDLTLDLK